MEIKHITGKTVEEVTAEILEDFRQEFGKAPDIMIKIASGLSAKRVHKGEGYRWHMNQGLKAIQYFPPRPQDEIFGIRLIPDPTLPKGRGKLRSGGKSADIELT